MSARPYSTFRSTAVTNAATSVRDSAGMIIGYEIQNLHSADISVKFYNLAAGDVTVGTSPVLNSIQVLANQSVVLRDGFRGELHDVGISIAATTELADSGTTAPITLPIIKLYFD